MSTMIDLRGRHLMKLADFTPEEITYLIDLAAELKAAKQRGPRGAEARRQGDRADLREGLDADALRVRGRRLRPGRARHLHRPRRLAHGPQGDGEGHRARARPHVRRDRVPRLRAGDGRGARRVGRRPGLQRAHRRVAPDPDPGRLPHLPGAHPEAAQRGRLLLPRRRALQHGRLVPRRRREARDGRPHRQPEVALAARRDRRARALGRRGDRRADHDHRGRRRGRPRRRRAPHRRLGLDGRGRRGLGGADRAAQALPGERRRRWPRPATRT